MSVHGSDFNVSFERKKAAQPHRLCRFKFMVF